MRQKFIDKYREVVERCAFIITGEKADERIIDYMIEIGNIVCSWGREEEEADSAMNPETIFN